MPCTSLGKKKCKRETHCAYNFADNTCSPAELLTNENNEDGAVVCATLKKKQCNRVSHCAYLSGSCTENDGADGETLSQEEKPDGQAVVSCAQNNKKQCRRDSNCHWHMELGCEANVISDESKNEETLAPAKRQTDAPISQPTAPTITDAPISQPTAPTITNAPISRPTVPTTTPPLYYPDAESTTCVTSPPNRVVTGYDTIEECCAFPWIDDFTTCMINTVDELLRIPEPSATPTTASPTETLLDVNGSPISPDCYSGRKWHRSRVTVGDSECTNDKSYPSAWDHESMSSYFLFDRPGTYICSSFSSHRVFV